MRVRWAILPGLLCIAPNAMSGEIDQDEALRLRRAGTIVPLEQLIEQARRQRPGEVLETELEMRDGGYRYEIEIMDGEGRVWEMYYDAGTGEPLGSERED
jgi:uncharacterized membrane protein YkoI